MTKNKHDDVICERNPRVFYLYGTINVRILNCIKTSTESVQIGKTLDCSVVYVRVGSKTS